MVTKTKRGCWYWKGALTRGGYGTYSTVIDGVRRQVLVHRLAYELRNGRIGSGLQIDHLCRVRHCVNPKHMEPVTPRVNTLRGKTPAATNAAKTHCVRGHAL